MTNINTSNGGAQKSRIIHNLIILDESGSVESIKAATITGFNEIVQTIKGLEEMHPEQEHFVSLVTFNGLGVKNKLFNKRAKTLKEMNHKSFRPDASTPLYDAIGFSSNKLRRIIRFEENADVLVTILTDGEENSSEEYTGASIKKLIGDLKKTRLDFYIYRCESRCRKSRSFTVYYQFYEI